jgi:hypothetical protein
MEEKGLMEEDWNDRQLEEEYNTIVKWAQEDVETSYNLLNNNLFITSAPSDEEVFQRH